jgi:hypothetical protein
MNILQRDFTFYFIMGTGLISYFLFAAAPPLFKHPGNADASCTAKTING